MTRKEKLEKELKEIKNTEFKELIDEHYPRFKALIGNCYKFRNSYSLPKSEEDYWWMYIKITNIKKSDLYLGREDEVLSYYNGFSFQADKYGKITIDFSLRGYVHSLPDEKISNEEFDLAWKELLTKCNKVNL